MSGNASFSLRKVVAYWIRVMLNRLADKCTGCRFAALLLWLVEKAAVAPLPVGPLGSSLIVGRRHPVVGELVY